MKTYYKLQAYYTDSDTKWICHETRSLNNVKQMRSKLLKAWSKYPNIKFRIIKYTEEVIK